MMIRYCEKCGQRLADTDLAAGHIVQTAEGKWVCAACAAPAAKPAAPRLATGAQIKTGSQRRPGSPTAVKVPSVRKTVPVSETVDTQPVPPGKPAAQRFATIAMYAGGVILLLAGILLLVAGRGHGKNKPAGPVAEAKGTPAASKDTPRKAEPPRKSPGLAGKPAAPPPTEEGVGAPAAKPQPPLATGAAPAPEAKELSPDERAKQVDAEMGNFRDQRAARLLEEHKAWFKQNPSDPWSYQARLRELVTSYGSAPATAEARKLLDELKSLPPPPDRLEASAPESKDYQLVYDLDLARMGHDITYDVDNRSKIKQPFDRIAYFLELQPNTGAMQYLYVSMDAFTDDLGKIGIPTVASGAHFQQNVANMNVCSNVEGIVTGTGLQGGNIEFWPNNYGPYNSANVPNAANDKYDWGDQPTQPVDGHGSMQVHNHDAKQTLFALNKWKDGGGADLGIGNQPTGQPDWTFSGCAGSYRAKRLRVLVHCK
ncbi:MAG: hypothetical protein ABSE73_09085 [Planctomycetota bacterium]